MAMTDKMTPPWGMPYRDPVTGERLRKLTPQELEYQRRVRRHRADEHDRALDDYDPWKFSNE
jgi:hypothetical protein